MLWDRGTITDLGTLGRSRSVATGINPSGEIVGAAVTDVSQHAILWTRK